MTDVAVVGAGIYGLSAALELNRRGYAVTVIDPGPIPHPLASSTDISKVVRMEYGADTEYLELAAVAREGWLHWNERFGETLYHECGLLALSAGPMRDGEFEHDSYAALCAAGYEPQRVDAALLRRRFPAWGQSAYADGFFHARAGYAESGRVIAALARDAQRRGVTLRCGARVTALRLRAARVEGLALDDGTGLDATAVVVAAGTWSPLLVPELQRSIRIVGQPVFHLQCKDPSLFDAERFPVFTADITNTGWYGFPWHPRERVIKIANHGIGVAVHPVSGQRMVRAKDRRRLETFVHDALPALADGEVTYTRLCLYCDTLDGHFFIDRHPHCEGLVIATGGSGHGFKFGPVLGGLIADALEGVANPALRRFRWRELGGETTAEEAARCWRAERDDDHDAGAGP